MANKRIIELQERTSIDMGDWLIVDSSTSTRKLSLATLLNYMTLTSMIFVTELPTTDISESIIYLVPHSGSTTDWDQYIYRDNEWIQIGTSTIDLSAIYQTKTDNNLQTTSKQIVGAINEVKSDLTNTNNRFSWNTLGDGTTAVGISIDTTGLAEISVLINAHDANIIEPYYSIVIPINELSATAKRFVLEGSPSSSNLIYVSASLTNVSIRVKIDNSDIVSTFIVLGR